MVRVVVSEGIRSNARQRHDSGSRRWCVTPYSTPGSHSSTATPSTTSPGPRSAAPSLTALAATVPPPTFLAMPPLATSRSHSTPSSIGSSLPPPTLVTSPSDRLPPHIHRRLNSIRCRCLQGRSKGRRCWQRLGWCTGNEKGSTTEQW